MDVLRPSWNNITSSIRNHVCEIPGFSIRKISGTKYYKMTKNVYSHPLMRELIIRNCYVIISNRGTANEFFRDVRFVDCEMLTEIPERLRGLVINDIEFIFGHPIMITNLEYLEHVYEIRPLP